LVITCYSMEDHLAVVNLLMERCGAGKDVVHAWEHTYFTYLLGYSHAYSPCDTLL
jgi:hypothetical protein